MLLPWWGHITLTRVSSPSTCTWEHQELQSQIAAIFGRKRPRRQPNRSGDAFFLKKSHKKTQSLAIFRRKEKSQGFLGGWRTLLGPKKSQWLFFTWQKIAIAIAEKSRHLVHSDLHLYPCFIGVSNFWVTQLEGPTKMHKVPTCSFGQWGARQRGRTLGEACFRLLETPFLEALLRTLLRTLPPSRTLCKTPSKNPSKNLLGSNLENASKNPS